MTIAAVVGDLLFKEKISLAAAQAGQEVVFLRDPAAIAGEANKHRLILVDLNHKKLDPVAAIADIRAGGGGVKILAFCAHVDEELMAKASAAGADDVMPRSRFVRELGVMLRDASRFL